MSFLFCLSGRLGRRYLVMKISADNKVEAVHTTFVKERMRHESKHLYVQLVKVLTEF
jgi:hypothetical protein